MKLDCDSLKTCPIEFFEEIIPYLALLSCQLAECKREGRYTIPVTFKDDMIIIHSGLKDWILNKNTFAFISCDDPDNIKNGKIQ
jgi:hypothetical protein